MNHALRAPIVSLPFHEVPVVGSGTQGPLVGIFTRPLANPIAGVLIIAGQPQTRVGSHRMFVTLARGLAARGVASLRFDCGGWGDSPGLPLPFEESAADIAVAAEILRQQLEAPALKIILLGLCDGATAAVLALPKLRASRSVPHALALINPWVRSEGSYDEAILRTYYFRQLLQPQVWLRFLSGRISLSAILQPIAIKWRTIANRRRPGDPAAIPGDLPGQLMKQLQDYRGEIWTILSGNDLTAAESEALIKQDKNWNRLLGSRPESLLKVSGADHTFSDGRAWQQVIDWLAARCGSASLRS